MSVVEVDGLLCKPVVRVATALEQGMESDRKF